MNFKDKENEQIIPVPAKEFQMSNQRHYLFQATSQHPYLFNISQILAYIRSWRLEEQKQDYAILIVPYSIKFKSA